MMSLAHQYLRIPEDYAVALGQLHWAKNGEAVELPSGDTFAFAAEIWQFLEGFTAVRPPLHFAHMLHLLHLLGVGPIRALPTAVAEFRRAMLQAGRPLRNAGVLCAELCRDLPATSLRFELAELKRALLQNAGERGPPIEVPPLSARAFQDHVFRTLERFSTPEIIHWLKFGQSPDDKPGQRLAEEVTQRPPNLLAALSRAARDRERLAGALALVSALNGALSLPPRQLDHQDLPIGGYADITTRGEPERLLPAQFALERDEFIRRYAEHELLFFRREEPSQPNRDELVLLLDQGVRTWGGVRLALAGAVFAFAGLAQRRRIPFRLATTSNGGELIDPLELDSEELATLLEASDLTSEPTESLRSILDASAEGLRDIVLLTHPRSLNEELAEVAAEVPAELRLFAVSVDSQGRGRFDQLRQGFPFLLSRFRVDLHATEAASVPKAVPTTASQPWTGAIEPVPFPFWFGPVRKVTHIALDTSGDWLLVAANHGLLHLQSVDGTRREVLPRGFVNHRVLTLVEAVLGTSSGFVVCGRVPLAAKLIAVACHYSIASRHVRVHVFEAEIEEKLFWFSFPDLHAIVCRGTTKTIGLDLDSGAFADNSSPDAKEAARAKAAIDRARQRAMPPPYVSVSANDTTGPWFRVHQGEGWFELGGVEPVWNRAAPTRDGQRLLKNAQVNVAQWSENILVIQTMSLGEPRDRLLVLQGPEGKILRELPLPSEHSLFLLSANGQLIAVQTSLHEVGVFATTSEEPALSVMEPGRLPPKLETNLGHDWLYVASGNHRHRFDWSSGSLKHETGVASRQCPISRNELAPYTRYDPSRFLAREMRQLRVEVDRFGHVLLLNLTGERLLAMLRFHCDHADAWMPDGTRWSSTDSHGEANSQAARRIGETLFRG